MTKIEWQSPLSIIQYPDPRLRAVNGRVGVFDDKLAALSREMFEVMYDSEDGGVGLAAPQVGVNLRLMVFNPGKDREKEEEIVLVNPQVVSASGPIRGFEEGCLSFPGIYGEVLVRIRLFCFALPFTIGLIHLEGARESWQREREETKFWHAFFFPDFQTPKPDLRVKGLIFVFFSSFDLSTSAVAFRNAAFCSFQCSPLRPQMLSQTPKKKHLQTQQKQKTSAQLSSK